MIPRPGFAIDGHLKPPKIPWGRDSSSAPPHPSLCPMPLAARPFDLLHEDIDGQAWERLALATERSRNVLGGRTLWSINSTARGGGVAETTRTLWPYWRGAGLDARWLVLEAPPAFFRLTKGLHNLLHGVDLRRPSLHDRELFESVARMIGAQAAELIDRGDVVILQDPQTAGLVPILKRAGATVVWRCHVGADRLSEPVESAWAFLLPYVEAADALVFTRRAFVPPGLDERRVRLLAPAIDPRSPKNQALSPRLAQAILAGCGLAGARGQSGTPRARVDGRLVPVRRRCHVLREGPAPQLGTHRLVVSLARWDRLKDPVGVMQGFAEHVHHPEARLILAGPAVGMVADDPEGGNVLGEARAAWRRLRASQRWRVQLATLPMTDLDENALIVNALQRQAAVIVKKSLQEGFGLGVTEAMWKARPVVATRVGGHQDQLEHRRTGLLVDDPADLGAFGAAIGELLDDRAEALDLGTAAREEARARFLADRHFCSWIEILAGCASGR